MTQDEKLDLLAVAFDLDVDELPANAKLDEVENWDSMTRLALVSMMDEKFHKSLKKEDMNKFSTVQDILDWMEA